MDLIQLGGVRGIDVVANRRSTSGNANEGVESGHSLGERSRFHSMANVVTGSSTGGHKSGHGGGGSHAGT